MPRKLPTLQRSTKSRGGQIKMSKCKHDFMRADKYHQNKLDITNLMEKYAIPPNQYYKFEICRNCGIIQRTLRTQIISYALGGSLIEKLWKIKEEN